jgi:two-component system response regulator FlrC
LIEPGDLFLDGVLPAADGRDDGPPAAFAALGELPLPAGTRLEDMERYLIFKTLREVDNNRTHAARMLGISIRTLRNKLREYREKYGSLPAAENPPSSPSP